MHFHGMIEPRVRIHQHEVALQHVIMAVVKPDANARGAVWPLGKMIGTAKLDGLIEIRKGRLDRLSGRNRSIREVAQAIRISAEMWCTATDRTEAEQGCDAH